jgi:fused signal recognition particle receptor
MANFNWFSRSFDKSSQAEKPAEKAEETSAKKDEQEAQQATSPQTMNSEDYLAWAKAAYQNIQKQQSTAEAPTAAAAPQPPEAPSKSVAEAVETESPAVQQPTTEPPAAEEISDSGVAAAAGEVPKIEPETVEVKTTTTGTSTTETSAPPQEPATEGLEPEPSPREAEITGSTETVEASQSLEQAAATGPAWMQSAAERQARLERLQETAIAEPEPAPELELEPAATTAAPSLPDINFDEAFLWSAEVLAGQGRQAEDISIEEITWLNRLRQGLDKTRRGLVNQLKAIVGQGPLNEDAVFEIEALLLQADVGVEATDAIIEALQAKLREEALPPDQAIAYLKKILRDMLDAPLGESHNLEFVPEKDTFNIWLMTGVNGAGKTTTIGKLAHIAKKSGYSCLIGAADTFRAAAVEQVKAWGARSDVDVIANPGKNTDPAAVVFDAITAAQSRHCELLLVDTAGRLQNKKNLMEELSKIRRIIDKRAPDAKIESLLVLDATLGQNGLQQAKVFAEAANLSGVVLTKLDGTARGGVALAVVQQLGLPIRFIGAGEGIEDLRPFSSYEFVEALLSG